MISLYQRLFRYRERPERTPLEDFLTEALADLLTRLPEDLARRCAARLLCDRPDAVSALGEAWPIDARAKWSTQRPIDGGRIIDLMLEVEGVPLIVVENKVAAGFQDHSSEDQNTREGVRQHQLATYGRWLARETNHVWGGAVVLLAHWTQPPADFDTAQTVYGCRFRTTVQWSDFARWLDGIIRTDGDRTTDWRRLGLEFLDFLKEQEMDSELATQHDLAALQIYVPVADRVRNTVEQIWESSKGTWASFCQHRDNKLELNTQYGCVWKFRYLSRMDIRRCYIAVGVRYPGVGNYPEGVNATFGPYLFVELGSDYNDSPLNGMEMPEIWFSGPDVRLAQLPLRNLPPEPSALVADASAWVEERMLEIAKVVS